LLVLKINEEGFCCQTLQQKVICWETGQLNNTTENLIRDELYLRIVQAQSLCILVLVLTTMIGF
jgi:hypothetical protein